MPGLLNIFFTTSLRLKAKLPRKNWACLEKINDPLFLRFYSCWPFEGGPEQMSPMSFSLIRTCWDSQVTF